MNGDKRTRHAIVSVILIAGVLPSLIAFFLHISFGAITYEKESIHEALELIGCTVGLFSALLITGRSRSEQVPENRLWAATGLVCMGVMDIAHSISPWNEAPGRSWLRHGSTLLGGIIFGLAWIRPPEILIQRTVPFLLGMGVFATVINLIILQWSESLPAITVSGHYSIWVIGANILGGFGFLSASIFFFRQYWTKTKAEELALAGHTLLFGVCGIFWGTSWIWAADWWIWHVFRLSAYLTLCIVVYKTIAEIQIALRASEERFRLLFEYSPIGIAVHPLNGKLEHTNAAFQQMLGYSGEELAQLTVYDITYPEDLEISRSKVEQLIIGKAENYQIEKRYFRKDGSVIWCKGSGSVVRDANGQPKFVIGAVVDITEQKSVFLKEVKAREEAERTLKIRGDFISIATHELRTPLTPLLLGIDGLARLIEKGSIEAREKNERLRIIRRMKQQVKRIQHMIELMILTSQIDAGDLVLNATPCDLSEIVRKTLILCQNELTDAGSPLKVNLLEELRGQWDVEKLENAIRALLENAAKYGLGRPIEITTSLINDQAKLSIRDYGIGLPKEDQSRLFERYQRGTSIEHYGGFGLGLYIAKEIIEAHGGRIYCENSPGGGAIFTIELPLVSSDRRGSHTQIKAA